MENYNPGQYQPNGQQPYGQQPYGQQPYNQQPYGQMPYQPTPTPGKGMAITALVLSIVGVCGSCFYGIGIVLLIVALILAIIAKAKGAGGMATAALIVSIVGLVIGLIIAGVMILSLGTYLGRARSAASSISYHNWSVSMSRALRG